MTNEEIALTQPKGTRFVKNEVTVLGGQYSGVMNSGRSVTLSGDGLVQVPVNYELSSDLFIDTVTSAEDVDATEITNGFNFNFIDNGDVNNQRISFWAGQHEDKLLILEFDATYNTATTIVWDRCFDGSTINPLPKEHTVVNGHNSLEVCVRNNNDATLYLYPKNIVDGDIDITNISVKEVTQVQGSVTYFDASQKEFIQVTNLPLSTTYDLKDGEYGAIVKLHTNSFSQEDIDAFNAEPELLIDWYFGNRTIPSGIVKGADDKVYYPVDDMYLELSYSESTELMDDYSFDDPSIWTLGDNASISDSKAYLESIEGSMTYVKENNGTYKWLSDNLYKVVFDVEQTNGPFGLCRNAVTNFEGNRISFDSDGITTRIYKATEDGYYLSIKRLDTSISASCSINSMSIKEILSEYIPVEGTYTYNTRLNYGIQDIRLELNDAGVPTSVIISKVNTNGEINTGFKLYAADGYTIEESLTIGSETHTWAWTSAGKVFKGGVEVGTYTVPADGTSLVLGDTTLDGQIISERYQTKVWTYIPHEYA